MILLLALTHRQLTETYEPGLGRLVGPRSRADANLTAAAGIPWAADNDAFSDWSEPRFVAMLAALAGTPGCLFVTAPDIVGDHAATLERYHHWAPQIHDVGLPVAFVAQDGCTPAAIPGCDAVFIGGTNAFKLSLAAERVAAEALHRRLWLHMGRVNSYRRMRYAHALGCQLIDGTNFARWNLSKLGYGKQWRRAAIAQTFLNLEETA